MAVETSLQGQLMYVYGKFIMVEDRIMGGRGVNFATYIEAERKISVVISSSIPR